MLVETLLLVVIVSWAKAGLAEWSTVFIAVTIIIGLVGGPLLRRREKNGSAEIPWKAVVPIMAFAMFGFLGLLNPSFINPVESFAYAEKEELEILERHLAQWRDIGYMPDVGWYGATAEFDIYFLNKR